MYAVVEDFRKVFGGWEEITTIPISSAPPPLQFNYINPLFSAGLWGIFRTVYKVVKDNPSPRFGSGHEFHS